jgi:hypothetical protein
MVLFDSYLRLKYSNFVVSLSPVRYIGVPQQVCSFGKKTLNPNLFKLSTTALPVWGYTKSIKQPTKKAIFLFSVCGFCFMVSNESLLFL